MRTQLSIAACFLFLGQTFCNPPQVLDSRLTLELVAEHPNIVTPTGIAVDAMGRIWCIENNTHQTASGYKGHKTDRIRVFEEFDSTGRAKKVTDFADGFRDSMGLTFGADGTLYLATRATVYRFSGREPKPIVRLETKGNYPHNGLCGFAWDANGNLIFGLGENLGESYRVIGSDGIAIGGGGEGGSVYRCRPDGTDVSRIATGFWNPFAQCIDANGNLFAVDNDPDARGPNRLLHVVQGGDFGYRFRYGRKGTHPFQCWNGELPGTLPMVAGTSEAPSGVIACDFTTLPDAFDGELLVTSWGDHTIERFRLSPHGASFRATSTTVVRGDEDFRPVAFAIAPDGSVVFSDWVKKEYPVHGHGRIWRLRAKPEAMGVCGKSKNSVVARPADELLKLALHSKSAAERMQAVFQLSHSEHARSSIPLLGDSDPFMVSAAIETIGRPAHVPALLAALRQPTTPSLRIGILLALRRSGSSTAVQAISEFLADVDPGVRRTAIQWIAEEQVTEFAHRLQAAATKEPVTRELFESWLAARSLLENRTTKDPGKNTVSETMVASILEDSKQPAQFHVLALRMLRHDHPLLTAGRLAAFVSSKEPGLQIEAMRTLIMRADSDSQTLLRKLALDDRLPLVERAKAVAGLSHSAKDEDTIRVLETAAKSTELKRDAERSLTDREPDAKARSLSEWRPLLESVGSAAAGERLFYHAKGPGCFKCHRINGRGGIAGPDLSLIGRSLSRDKMIESIVTPSKEIAPAFTTWRITTVDGRERIAMIVGETHDSKFTIADSLGVVTQIHRNQIEERTPVPVSIMPENLPQLMTPDEFRDLLAFLMERK